MKSLMALFKTGKVGVLTDQAIFSGTNFAVTLLAARILGPNDFGLFTSVMLFVFLMLSITSALIIQPVQVNLASSDNERDYMSFSFFAQLSVVLIMAVITLGLLQVDLELIKGLNRFSLLIVLYLICYLFHDYFRRLFLAMDAIKNALLIDALNGFLQTVTLLYCFLMTKSGLSDVFLILIITYLPGLLVAVIILKPVRIKSNQWLNYCRMHLKQGSWLLMTAILQWWSNNLFVVAAGIFLGNKALGAFRLVQSFFGILNVLLQTLENYALPQAVRLYKSSSEMSMRYLRQISIKGAFVFGIILLFLFLFSEFVIRLTGGPEYAEYAFVVRGMAILYTVIFIGYPIRMVIRMMVLNQLFFRGYIISFLFSLVTFHFMLREWHLWGAIIGLISNQLIMLAFWQFILIKKQIFLWR